MKILVKGKIELHCIKYLLSYSNCLPLSRKLIFYFELLTDTIPGCVFRAKKATIPAGKRPPFRWEKGQHSDSIAATIPTKKASA